MSELEGGITPSDVDAERMVIGSCLLQSGAIDAAMALLQSSDFHYRPHSWMFTAICELRIQDKPVNAKSVMRRLAEMKPEKDSKRTCLDECGADEIVRTIEGVLPEHVIFWSERVKRKRQERELLDFSRLAAQAALSNSEDSIREVAAKLEAKLAAIGGAEEDRSVYTMRDSAVSIEQRIQRYIDDPDAITGMATGWYELDEKTDGFEAGNVTIVYAPTSRFKSMFTQNIGYRLALAEVPGLWFTTEMPHYQVTERILQMEIGHNLRWMRKGRGGRIQDIQGEIRSGLKTVGDMPIYICDRAPLDIAYVRSEVARQKRWNNIGYVIIDLVDQVLSSRYGDQEISNQSHVMGQIKAMAKASAVHVFVVTHISKKDAGTRMKADLDVDDMKGSSSKGQDVDIAISLMPVGWNEEHQDWYGLSRKEIEERTRLYGEQTILVAITKSRNGELARIPFTLDMSRGMRMFPRQKPPTQFDFPEAA